ncbi:ImmA/IrrE family metallo-endopeptidase [Bradyrhizobium sp. SZCCHNR1098]|uniref:ImmA/IrrE family metallo-endopeptidase n=1 Tax=Bradyrhizobium sp. SZCCHNR1098 TaxID=3057370 RepID=UPI00291618AC|nr:ImmA/IrrE family metallo-endopeptidase [Bradyrhizobium sp. SZCCHNR1098]
MSTDDYIVDPLRDFEVREHAKTLRRALGWADADRVDPLSLEPATELWTIRGKRPFKLELAADAEMSGESGLTTYDGTKILVKIPRRIRQKAFMGDGYARFTIAHELGHASLHLDKLMLGAALPRRLAGNTLPKWIPKFKSAEHQANIFGAALLINDATARRLSSPEEISVQAGVSLTAARIYFEQVQEDLARPTAAARVQKIADEARAALAPKPSIAPIAFLNDPCSCCGQQKLFPVGHKFMCQACDTVYDRFQDGDGVE